MQNNDKVALFDFCETIANFQTADAYVRFVLQHSNHANRKLQRLNKLLNKIKVYGIMRRVAPKLNVEKRMILYQLRGLSYEELDQLALRYYEEKIKKNFIEPVIKELIQLQKQDYKIYIVSAGYEIYLKYFVKEFNVDGLLSTRLKFHDGRCTGLMDGKDCMYEYKIDYIKSSIPGDGHQWYAFSDSVTDLPMLELVGNPVAITRKYPQEWAQKRNIKQLIW